MQANPLRYVYRVLFKFPKFVRQSCCNFDLLLAVILTIKPSYSPITEITESHERLGLFLLYSTFIEWSLGIQMNALLLEKNIGFQTEYVFSEQCPDAGLTSASLSFYGGNLTPINFFYTKFPCFTFQRTWQPYTGSLEAHGIIAIIWNL